MGDGRRKARGEPTDVILSEAKDLRFAFPRLLPAQSSKLGCKLPARQVLQARSFAHSWVGRLSARALGSSARAHNADNAHHSSPQLSTALHAKEPSTQAP